MMELSHNHHQEGRMRLDRELQKKVLSTLSTIYPNGLDETDFSELLPHLDKYVLFPNLVYLDQHGLISFKSQHVHNGLPVIILASATAKGMDFMADDGGLSAILGVMTVRLHDDTIKGLIEARILESDISQPEKKRFLDQLRGLPGETTKHLVLKLVDLGLAKGPQAIATIGEFLSKNPLST